MPKSVQELLQAWPSRSCVAGGFIRSCIANEEINDVDIFASSKEVALNMADLLVEASARFNPGIRKESLLHTSANAYSVKGFKLMPQIIHRWTFNDVKDVVPSFDFTVARAAIYWSCSEWVSICDPEFYPDLAAKRLSYCSPDRNEDAGGSFLRMLKFYQRGYRIPLDSAAAVITRLIRDLKPGSEAAMTEQIIRLLHEVDPQVDPGHDAHLPAQ